MCPKKVAAKSLLKPGSSYVYLLFVIKIFDRAVGTRTCVHFMCIKHLPGYFISKFPVSKNYKLELAKLNGLVAQTLIWRALFSFLILNLCLTFKQTKKKNRVISSCNFTPLGTL